MLATKDTFTFGVAAIVFIAATLAFIIGLVMHPHPRAQAWSFWLMLGLVLVAFGLFWTTR